MRQEDCIKRYTERMGEEWRTTAKDRKNRRLLFVTLPNIYVDNSFSDLNIVFISTRVCLCACV